MNKNIINLCFVVLFINFSIENNIQYFDSRDFIILFQTGVNIFFLIYVFFSVKNLTRPKLGKYVIFISLFLLIVGVFSSDVILTYNKISKFILPLFFVYVGFNILNSIDKLEFFVSKLWVIQLLFIIEIFYANFYSVGETFYDQGIFVGYLSVNSLYTVCFTWITLLFFLKSSKLSKGLSIIILVITFIIFLLILKRTLILLAGIAFFFYVIQNISLKKIISSSVIFSVMIIFFQMFLTQYFEQSLEARSSRFSENYSIGEEGRIQENILPFLYMDGRNPLIYFFGTGEVFNDRPFFRNYLQLDRELHNSFVRLFWSGGFVVLAAFLLFYYKQAKILLFLKNLFSQTIYQRFFYFGLVFVFLRFISEFSSGITYISYNLFSYLLIGALISLETNTLSQKNIN
jgi:hypothetical protein